MIVENINLLKCKIHIFLAVWAPKQKMLNVLSCGAKFAIQKFLFSYYHYLPVCTKSVGPPDMGRCQKKFWFSQIITIFMLG